MNICGHLTISLASRRALGVTMHCFPQVFTAAGSAINLCALDMCKAFDEVDHYTLWIKLMDHSVPLIFLHRCIGIVLCSAVVWWENVFSAEYC